LIKYKYPDSKLIFGAFDHRLFGTGAYQFDSNSIKSYIRYIDRRLDITILKYLIERYVDGIIANQGPISRIARSMNNSIPIQTVRPYIQPNRFKQLSRVTPELDSKTAIMIGTALDYKGPDLLVQAWPLVREKHPDAELYITGSNHPESYTEIEGIHLPGYVSDSEIMEYLGYASLYVHPARAEAFGISVLEAMRAGVPPLVTTTTGAASEVEQIDQSLVVKADPVILADRISECFSTSRRMKQKWSERAQEQSKQFDKESRVKEFTKKFEYLCNEI
jgi:glycosyltransferase involved in cell wall biosynthesis